MPSSGQRKHLDHNICPKDNAMLQIENQHKFKKHCAIDITNENSDNRLCLHRTRKPHSALVA